MRESIFTPPFYRETWGINKKQKRRLGAEQFLFQLISPSTFLYLLLMAEKYKHYYVPQSLVKNWSEDGKHAQWFEPMTQKIIPNGGNGRYFHSNLVDIPEAMEETLARINLYFENLIHSFLNGDTGWLRSDDLISAREVLMFQLLQTPGGVFSPTSLFSVFSSSLKLFLDYTARKETEEKKRTEKVKGALKQMMIYGIDLLDMEAVILDAPENRSFILGSSPVTLINPYFSSSKPEKYLGLQAFELWGSVIVLPLSPEKALCIYDPETYTPVIEDKRVKLINEDIDTLNRAMLYNSGDGGGVIHVCGTDYINDLYDVFDEEDDDYYRDLYIGDTLDEYPFPTKLSVLKIRKEAEKELKKRKKEPVRPFINAIVDYDDEHLDNIDEKNRIKVFSKRFKDAEKILYSNNDDSRKK